MSNERLFAHFCPAEPTAAGRAQFAAHQSKGLAPERPDGYYLALTEGKRRFDFVCREYQQMFTNGEWWGFYQLWQDWRGARWVLPHLCSWYGDLPEWLGRDEEPPT